MKEGITKVAAASGLFLLGQYLLDVPSADGDTYKLLEHMLGLLVISIGGIILWGD